MADILTSIAHRAGPVMVFLLTITVVARGCDAIGVFDAAGAIALRQARGRTFSLWLLIMGLAVAATAVLSLDTTAVLLTPIVIVVTRRAGIAPTPFAMTTLWLANTASLFFPVSNLTNLLAMHQFAQWHIDVGEFALMMAIPATTAVLVTDLLIVTCFRRHLLTRYDYQAPSSARDPVAMRIATLTCIALGPAFISGIEPAIVSSVAAAIIVATLAWRNRPALRALNPPWLMAVGILVLFTLVELARRGGLDDILRMIAGSEESFAGLLRLAGTGMISANIMNNLPAYIALEGIADSPIRLAALLIGVNCGPIITLWGSLATLLWRERCRANNVHVSVWGLMALGTLCAVVVVTTSVLALWISPLTP